MAKEILLSPQTAQDILTEIGSLGTWLQAIGIIFIVWILIQFASFLINKKKFQTLKLIREDLSRIEKKVDNMQKKKSSS